jgi:hypothetical protein
MDVYWSTVYPPEVYSDYNLLYREPRPLLPELAPLRGSDNPHDFFACPAFHLHSQNTFVIRSALGANVALRPDGFAPLDEASKLTGKLFSYMHPTRVGYRTILFDHRMLFFCAEPLTLFTYPAYMHRTEVQTSLVYVPAAYDISKWLRPLQGTFEIPEATTTVRIREEDPLYYVRFNTTDKVRLRRFQAVPELHAIAQGCVHYKVFKPRSSLERVYAAFTGAKQDRRVLRLIREHLLD